MNFDFGAAQKLYAQQQHPRIFCGPADLPKLRAQVQRGPSKKIMVALRERTQPVIARVQATANLTEDLAHWNEGWSMPKLALVFDLHNLALIGVLDQDPDVIEAARRVVLALPAAEHHRGRKSAVLGSGFSHGFGLQSTIAYDLLHAHLSPSQRRMYCDWMLDFGVRNTLANLSTAMFRFAGGNLVLGQFLCGLTGLLAIDGEPGMPDLGAERQQMILMLEGALEMTLGPNGYPSEDIGYGSAMGAGMSYVVEALRRAGWYDAYRTYPRYAKFGRALLHFVQPWGRRLSNTGDHGDDFPHRGFVLNRLAEATNDPTLLWLQRTLHYPMFAPPGYPGDVSIGKDQSMPVDATVILGIDPQAKPVPPTQATVPTQFMDPGRGVVSFRSGWRADDTLLLVDGCHRPAGAWGHGHDSCGHFSISALGEYFAIDTGRYNMEQNCHNMVLINGRSGRSNGGLWRESFYHGLLTEYHPGEFCDAAAVDSSHLHNCFWARRHVGLVKGGQVPGYVWTVDDINNANDWAEFWWQLHTSPENTITLRKNSATIKGCRQGNLMDVHLALPLPGSYPKDHTVSWEQDIAVPSSHQYVTDVTVYEKNFARPRDMVHHSMMRRPRLLAKVAGYNGRFMSVMIPRRKGEPPAQVEQLASLDNSLALKITFPKVVDTLIFAYEHNLIEAGDVSERGQWCVVRRSRRTGRVIERAVGRPDGVS